MVYIIGAGPGDPELITVKGQRLLKEADVIIFNDELSPYQIRNLENLLEYEVIDRTTYPRRFIEYF